MAFSEKTGNCSNNKFNTSQKILILFIMGFFITLVGIIILILATVIFGEGSTNFGALIFIGPIPIVVGVGPDITWIVLLTIILTVLSIILLLIMRKETMKQKS